MYVLTPNFKGLTPYLFDLLGILEESGLVKFAL